MKFCRFMAEGSLIAKCELPLPVNQNSAVVKMLASSFNRADLLQRKGRYPPPPGHSEIIGLDGVCQFQGRPHLVLLNGGGYATHALIDKRHTIAMPETMKLSQAAAITEVWLTAYQILQLAQVKKGDKVLIYAGGSGVGTAAIQLCNLLEALPIALTSAEKVQSCRALKCWAYDYKATEWREQIREDHKSVEVVLDCVGSSHFQKGISLLSTDGRLILYGLLSGAKLKQFDLSTLLQKRIKVISTTLRSRSDDYKASLISRFKQTVWPNLAKGELRPTISRELSCDWTSSECNQVFQEGLSLVESNKTVGKVVVIYKH